MIWLILSSPESKSRGFNQAITTTTNLYFVTEEGVKEGNKAIPVDREEGESFNPLGVTPCTSAKELVWRLHGLGPGVNGDINSGTQQANGGIGRLIISPTRRTPLQQRNGNSRRVTLLVQETDEV